MRKVLILSLIFGTLAIIYTYPLVFYFTKGMPYSYIPARGYEVTHLIQGDYLQVYYFLWLFKDAAWGKTSFFQDPYQFNCNGAKFSTQLFPLSLIFLIFSIFGNITAYNCLVILSFILSGISAYLLVEFYTKNKYSALLGGIIFSLAPVRVAHLLSGHPNGFLFFLMPLSIYFIEKALSENRPRYGIFSGLCILSLALMELYLIYYLFLFLAFLIPLRILSARGKSLWKGLMPLLLFMLLALFWLFSVKSPNLSGSIMSAGRKMTEVRLYAPNVPDIFRRINTQAEKYIYPGIIPPLLGFLGFISGIRKKPMRIVAIFFGIVFVFTFILSLGPNLKHIPLYAFCYKYIPYFNFSRCPIRISVLSFLSISILCGIGIGQNLPSNRIAKKIILVVVFLLILFDYHPSKTIGISIVDKTNRVYSTITENIEDKRLLELPIWPGDTSWSSIYLFHTTNTRAKMINGYSPAVSKDYITDIFFPLRDLNFGEIGESEHKLLNSLNVKYITLHEDAFPRKVSPYPPIFSLNNLKNSRYVKFIMHDHPVWLFEVLDTPSEFHSELLQSSAIGICYQSEHLFSRIGKKVTDFQASGVKAVLGEKFNQSDHLTFGPYRLLPAGRYKAIFRLKADDNTSGKIAKIDVSTDQGKTVLGEKIVCGTDFHVAGIYQDFTIGFNLKKPQRLEFRVYFYGNSRLWSDYVYIIFAEEQEPRFVYEAEELFHTARIVRDGVASGRKALLVKADVDPGDHVISGPYRRYPEGKYTTTFYIKSDYRHPEPVVRLEVSTNRRARILASSTLSGRDFKEKDIYEPFSLSYSLDKPEVLEFLIFFYKKGNIAFDRIEVNRS